MEKKRDASSRRSGTDRRGFLSSLGGAFGAFVLAPGALGQSLLVRTPTAPLVPGTITVTKTAWASSSFSWDDGGDSTGTRTYSNYLNVPPGEIITMTFRRYWTRTGTESGTATHTELGEQTVTYFNSWTLTAEPGSALVAITHTIGSGGSYTYSNVEPLRTLTRSSTQSYTYTTTVRSSGPGGTLATELEEQDAAGEQGVFLESLDSECDIFDVHTRAGDRLQLRV